MRGVYSHITARILAELRDRLQMLWESSLHERALLAERSAVALLNELLTRRPGRLFPALLAHFAPIGNSHSQFPWPAREPQCQEAYIPEKRQQSNEE
jgi:hypothetical protein